MIKYRELHMALMNTVDFVHEKNRPDYVGYCTMLIGIMEMETLFDDMPKHYPMESFLILTMTKRDPIKDVLDDSAYKYFVDSDDAEEQVTILRQATEDRARAAGLFLDFAYSMKRKGKIIDAQIDWFTIVAALMEVEGTLGILINTKQSIIQKWMFRGMETSLKVGLGIE